MDTAMLIGRVLVSLGAVLGVMWVLARKMRGGAKRRGGGLIEVLGRQQVSRGASVAVVRVGDTALVVGVTDTQVSVLGDTDLAAAQALLEDGAAPAAPRAPRTVSRGPSRGTAGHRRHAAGSRTVRVEQPAAHTPATHAPAAHAATPEAPARPGALAGSALSPATWKQTIESLRELTARTD